ncbi:MAG: hypothetical protein WA281_11100, partial [Mycobacterium sp.]
MSAAGRPSRRLSPVYGHVVSLLITVPVYGQHEYSHAVVGDLEREGAEYLIVDNRGDY